MSKQRTFWPNNPIYIALCVLLIVATPWIPLYRVGAPAQQILIAFSLFVAAVFAIFFYCMRITVDSKNVEGPILSIWPGKIPRKEVNCFFNESILGSRYIIIRHKNSGKQIQVPSLFYTASTIKEIQQTLK